MATSPEVWKEEFDWKTMLIDRIYFAYEQMIHDVSQDFRTDAQLIAIFGIDEKVRWLLVDHGQTEIVGVLFLGDEMIAQHRHIRDNHFQDDRTTL